MLNLVAVRNQTALRAEAGLKARPYDGHHSVGAGLQTRPAEPAFARTRSYSMVLDGVRRALRQEDRLIVVTGDSGTGKTQLCRALIEEADLLTFTSVMLHPPSTPEDLLAQFLRDVGMLDNGTSALLRTRSHLVMALQRFLESLIPLGARAVLVIDEAQHLPPVVLEQLRLALNFETSQAPLLQVVLVGQPELHTLLRWPELRSVAQRISREYELTGLHEDELPEFLEECLANRGCGPLVRFTPAAERMLMTASQGVPRQAERLCGRALELASVERARKIEPRMVSVASQRLGLETVSPYAADRQRRMKLAAAGAVTCLALAVGAWGWMRGSRGNQPPAPPIQAAAVTSPSVAPGAVAATPAGGNVYIVLPPAAAAAMAPVPVAAVPSRQQTAPSAPRPLPPAPLSAEAVYRASVTPQLDKLRELGPFVLSAASSPDPRVAAAVIAGVASVHASLAALQAPTAVRGSHVMVLGATDQLSAALAPDFTGDRVAAVRQAMSTIDVVGKVLVGEW